jgi:hypothetical protein
MLFPEQKQSHRVPACRVRPGVQFRTERCCLGLTALLLGVMTFPAHLQAQPPQVGPNANQQPPTQRAGNQPVPRTDPRFLQPPARERTTGDKFLRWLLKSVAGRVLCLLFLVTAVALIGWAFGPESAAKGELEELPYPTSRQLPDSGRSSPPCGATSLTRHRPFRPSPCELRSGGG